MRSVAVERLRQPSVYARVAILWSETSRQAKVSLATTAGQTYTFTGADGAPKTWLRGEYGYLAPNALSTSLNRFNIKHDLVDDAALSTHLEQYDVLFLPGAETLDGALIAAIEAWLAVPGKFLVVTGPTNLPPEILGLRAPSIVHLDGYTAWRWLPGSPFADRARWEAYTISSYKGYRTCLVAPIPGAQVLAQQLLVSGDLSSPHSATVTELGPAVIATAKTLFVANQFFEYLGGALQGHINIEEIRHWFNVTHWAETLLYQIRWVLQTFGPGWLWDTRLKAFGSYAGAMTLRHDVDASDDRTMLEHEARHLVPGTWQLLDPAFSPDDAAPGTERVWAQALRQHEFMEVGLHNDSLAGSPPRWMIGGNFLHHVQESAENLGITISTCGRHGGYSVYPEMIDAMDHLFERLPHVLGTGTFCFHYMTEYGQVEPGLLVDGKAVTYVTDTDPTIATPGFWFPFHAVIATAEHACRLRGWDTTHEYDSPPDLVDLVLRRSNSKDGDPATQLPDAAVQFQYHPLFAQDPAYNDGRGTFDWLCYAITQAESLGLWLASQKMLYERLRDYEGIEFRSSRDGTHIEIHNPTDHAISELMFERRSGLPAVHWGHQFLAHIVDGRYCTIPPLEPGGRLTLEIAGTSRPHPLVRQPNGKGLRFTHCAFGPVARVLAVCVRIIRQQELLSEGWPAGAEVAVHIDGIPRSAVRADAQGRIRLTLHGRENGFDDRAIRLSIT